MKKEFQRSENWYKNQKLSKQFFDEYCKIFFIGIDNKIHCHVCQKETEHREKTQGLYGFAYACRNCKTATSPLAGSVFGGLKTHLSVYLKMMYLVRVKDPEISQKDLYIELNLDAVSSRKMRRKVEAISEKSQDYEFFLSVLSKIKRNLGIIRSEKPAKKLIEKVKPKMTQL